MSVSSMLLVIAVVVAFFPTKIMLMESEHPQE